MGLTLKGLISLVPDGIESTLTLTNQLFQEKMKFAFFNLLKSIQITGIKFKGK